MPPTTHEEFAIRDSERTAFEQKTGKSIMLSIKDGDDVPEFLMKQYEQDVYLDMRDKQRNLLNKYNPEPNPEAPDEAGRLIEVNGEWKPEFDNSGNQILY